MVEENQSNNQPSGEEPALKRAPARRRRRPASDVPPAPSADGATPDAPAEAAPKRTTRRRRPAAKAEASPEEAAPAADGEAKPTTTRRRRPRKPATAESSSADAPAEPAEPTPAEQEQQKRTRRRRRPAAEAPASDQAEVERSEAAAPAPQAPPEPVIAHPAVEAGAEAPQDQEQAPERTRRSRRGRRGGQRHRHQTAEQVVAGVPAVVEPEEDWPDLPEEEETEATVERKRHRHRPARNLSEIDATPSKTADISFMHPSEREFANLLDYYHIKYLYEPRSFPIRWEGNRVAEMHTPDFYLPEYDQYFELTTMKQSLVTQKNRKLRRVKELYPEVNIQLLYRRDLMRLMGKYGFGPLADVDVTGTERVLFSEGQVQERVAAIGRQITEDYRGKEPILIGVLRGVVVFMADLMRHVDLPVQIEFMEISHYGEERAEAIEVIRDAGTDIAGRHVIVIEDIVDTGLTLTYLLEHLRAKKPASVKICALLDKSVRRMARVPIDYVGFEIPDEFVIGYGLDYGGRYRNLPYIGVLKPQEPKAVAQR